MGKIKQRMVAGQIPLALEHKPEEWTENGRKTIEAEYKVTQD